MDWRNQSQVSMDQLLKELHLARTEIDINKTINSQLDIFK